MRIFHSTIDIGLQTANSRSRQPKLVGSLLRKQFSAKYTSGIESGLGSTSRSGAITENNTSSYTSRPCPGTRRSESKSVPMLHLTIGIYAELAKHISFRTLLCWKSSSKTSHTRTFDSSGRSPRPRPKRTQISRNGYSTKRRSLRVSKSLAAG
jgi:hypothetical protein